MDHKNIKRIVVFALIMSFLTFGLIYGLKNASGIGRYFLNECNLLEKKDVTILNNFFNNSGYNGDIKYWCEQTDIKFRLPVMSGKTIPKEIGKLINLKSLDLSEKGLIGKIPKEIGNLPKLELLLLKGNNLDGIIPREIGNLQKLKSLDISNNKLTGEISKELGLLNKLVFLNFSNNQLSGKIPKELDNLQGIEYIDYKNNNLIEK